MPTIPLKRAGLWVSVGAVVLAGAAFCAGLRVNRTSSFPVGFYRLTGGDWHKGDLVLVDVPVDRPVFQMAKTRGYLFGSLDRSGVVPILKRVVAVHGDFVEVARAVRVNGIELANSVVQSEDSAGRPMPVVSGGVVPDGQVWLMSDENRRSFDSRYFGPVPAELIRGPIKALWTW
jgi:conjugative transfer signal peptidase TraF